MISIKHGALTGEYAAPLLSDSKYELRILLTIFKGFMGLHGAREKKTLGT
jgi:hypothetical protein